jgi:putative FmdB family regulatory protein
MLIAQYTLHLQIMPTYVYKREDGTTFEIEQRITADSLTHCPTTGQRVERVISAGTGLIFKGSGFYITDYARKNGSAPTPGSEKSGSEAAEKPKKESSDTASKKESKKESNDSSSKPDSTTKPNKAD